MHKFEEHKKHTLLQIIPVEARLLAQGRPGKLCQKVLSVTAIQVRSSLHPKNLGSRRAQPPAAVGVQESVGLMGTHVGTLLVVKNITVQEPGLFAPNRLVWVPCCRQGACVTRKQENSLCSHLALEPTEG